MFHLANKLTFLRMLMAPFIVILLYYEGSAFCILAALAFTFASITDMVDGYIARRENMVTNLGKFLDPLADKVLVCSVLIMLVYLGWVQAWIAIVMVCRELVVTGLRAIAIDEGIVLAADDYGKLKTVLQFFALIPLIIHYQFLGFDLQPIGKFLLYLSVILAVYSGGNYVRVFLKSSAITTKN